MKKKGVWHMLMSPHIEKHGEDGKLLVSFGARMVSRKVFQDSVTKVSRRFVRGWV